MYLVLDWVVQSRIEQAGSAGHCKATISKMQSKKQTTVSRILKAEFLKVRMTKRPKFERPRSQKGESPVSQIKKDHYTFHYGWLQCIFFDNRLWLSTLVCLFINSALILSFTYLYPTVAKAMCSSSGKINIRKDIGIFTSLSFWI